jgi:hypothetical protein
MSMSLGFLKITQDVFMIPDSERPLHKIAILKKKFLHLNKKVFSHHIIATFEPHSPDRIIISREGTKNENRQLLIVSLP